MVAVRVLDCEASLQSPELSPPHFLLCNDSADLLGPWQKLDCSCPGTNASAQELNVWECGASI